MLAASAVGLTFNPHVNVKLQECYRSCLRYNDMLVAQLWARNGPWLLKRPSLLFNSLFHLI